MARPRKNVESNGTENGEIETGNNLGPIDKQRVAQLRSMIATYRSAIAAIIEGEGDDLAAFLAIADAQKAVFTELSKLTKPAKTTEAVGESVSAE